MARRNRIGFVVVDHPVFRQSCLVNAVVALRSAGYEVDLIEWQDGRTPSHEFGDRGVSTYFYRRYARGGVLNGLLGRLGFISLAMKAGREKRYRCLVGVDPEGLIVASLVGLVYRVPIIYYSLELHLSGGRKTIRSRLRKLLERLCNQHSAWTIIQDWDRATCLMKENRIVPDRFLVVPNTPMGEPKVGRRDWWHKRFGLQPLTKVILYAGGIADWALALEITRATSNWPEDWVLVLHGYGNPQYLSQVEAVATLGRALVSCEMVPYGQLDDLIASADVGIALYKNLGENFYHAASGKVAHYLRCGVPVVAQDFPNLRNLLHGSGSGICVGEPEDVRSAVEAILQDWQEYSGNAHRCYVEELESSRHFNQVIDKIDGLGDIAADRAGV